MEKCGCGKEVMNDSLEICRKCVIHNVEIHDAKTLSEHWLCSSTILDSDNVRRVFHEKRLPEQNMMSEHALCAKCGYAELKRDLSGVYCKLGKFKPIKYCRHFFNPGEF